MLAALWLAPGATAADPTSIFSDYMLDGKLSCKYSRADLNGALLDATLSQYGDPYTIAGFKKAIRRQLAPGGCARANAGSSGTWWTAVVIGIPILAVLAAGGWTARRALFRRFSSGEGRT